MDVFTTFSALLLVEEYLIGNGQKKQTLLEEHGKGLLHSLFLPNTALLSLTYVITSLYCS